jgi:glutaredoxin-related protein
MDRKYYISGPIEFLNLIRNCSLFCTDSFHGVAFSIVFEKPFVVFDRVDETQSMNSRLDTILTKFDLIDRKWDKMKFYDNYKNIDYMGIARILDAEKQKAINFLKISINSKEE